MVSPPSGPSGTAPAAANPTLNQQLPEQGQGPHLPHSQQDMAAIKLTRGTSCVLCQQRKVRCDKNKPCANCVKARVECRVVPPQPPRRRKKRLQEKDLIERLRKYENLLSENNIRFESISSELLPGQGLTDGAGGNDDVTELETDFEGLRTSPKSSESASISSRRTKSVNEKPSKWFPFHKEFRASEHLLYDSSEEDADEGSKVHHAFDKMYESQEGFPFMVGGRSASVTHLHPSAIHIFQLWQIYINRVNPLLRLTHAPTIQGRIIEVSARLDSIPKELEALMFAIYLVAVNTLEENEAVETFGESKTILLTRFHSAAQQSLINAGFMRTSDVMVLQAYTLYLTAVRQFMDPRQIFCLLAIAIRMAQRMGLHRDPALLGLSPFEVEHRRRLWWTLVCYDGRIGEMTGSTVTALSFTSDTNFPLNINDTDLHVDGKEPPIPHAGATEMIFCLARLELSLIVRSDSNRDVPIKPNIQSEGGAASLPTPASSSAATSATPGRSVPSAGPGTPTPTITVPPIPTVRSVARDNISYTLDGFSQYIENQYLRHCDERIPLHFFTLTMTRQMLLKMRITAFLVRLGHGDGPPGGSPSGGPSQHPLDQAKRDELFRESIQLIEYDVVLQSAPSLRPYKWFTYMHFPFPAYMFLVNELRRRTTGATVDRAWIAVTESYEKRELMNKLHNPMHMAFGRLFIKAWDAYEAAQRELGKEVVEPAWLAQLRAHTERSKNRRGHGHGRETDDGASASSFMGSMMVGSAGGGFAGLPRYPAAAPVAPIAEPLAAPLIDPHTSPREQEQLRRQIRERASGRDLADMDWSYIMQEYNSVGMAGFGQGESRDPTWDAEGPMDMY
ncbi:hypothetical protein jhhlp_003426 [Lomentospora prolificans]|uniref:Zn(2)-C6 fungal-type domain-containing protein n=1 Tax=Lomentospora prolificans TaxID=41688 RepID=A0A2N3N8U1_9PEZI|nr:hypothetical protein jhhlp_003426 [Lomentospora prolificans]